KDFSVFVHDSHGDTQIQAEGNVYGQSFSADSKTLYYLRSAGGRSGYELWKLDLASGRSERMLPGIGLQEYSVSRDGRQVLYSTADAAGHSSLWVCPSVLSASPTKVPVPPDTDSSAFLPDDTIVFRAPESGVNYLF